MDSITAGQVLAGLIHAPVDLARATVARLEPEDFGTWIHRTIFSKGLLKCTLAEHPEPGSVIIQINRHLLAGGHYTDTDNGLRRAVEDLAGMVGHPEQLHLFVNDLIEQRYRRAVGDFALAAAEHATNSPIADVDAALARIEELRRLRQRIHNNTVHIVRKGAA